MAEFDPYLKWLGIREASRPINHYRLLGLDLYESDKDVISMAADRQMAHIRTYQSGPNGDLSQQILNELARARRCLLVSDKKQAYDQKLREELAPVPPPLSTTNPILPPVVQPTVVESPIIQSMSPVVQPIVEDEAVDPGVPGIGVRTDPNARTKTKKREQKQLIWGLVSWVSGGLAAVGVGAVLLGSGILGGNNDPEIEVPVAERNGKKLSPVDIEKPKIVKKSETPEKKGKDVIDPANPVGDLNDLRRVAGLGAMTEVILKKSDVTSLPKLASISASDVQIILRKANVRGTEGRLPEYARWIMQAKKLIGDTTPIKASSANLNSTPSTVATIVPPTVWSTSNLAGYPRPSVDARALITQVVFSIKSNRLSKLGSSFGTPDAPDPPPAGRIRKFVGLEENALMIGLAYSSFDGKKIKTLQPLYYNQTRVFWGKGVGRPDSDSTFVLANEGYAVGEVQVSIHDPIHCFRIRFMKITRTGLDSNDSYYSSWHGVRTGPVTTIENTRGAPVVAMYGDCTGDDQVHSLGLVAAHPAFAPTKLTLKDANSPNTPSRFIGTSLPVISREPFASATNSQGPQEEVVVFYNRMARPVEVFRVDQDESQKRYFSLAPGAMRSQFTCLGAVWHIKDGSNGIATFQAIAGRNSAVIDGREPDPDGRMAALNSAANSSAELAKVEMPSSAERSAALKEVKKTYDNPVDRANGRATATKNREQAETLINDADDQSANPALQYALLETAKEVALVYGDSDTALRAVRELDRRFEGFDLWPEVVETIEDAGRSLVRTGDKLLASDLEDNIRQLIDESMDQMETQASVKLVTFAGKAAARKGDAKAVAYYKIKDNQIDDLKKLQKLSESAVAKLATDANNAQANEQQGKYLFVVKRELTLALACWSKSNDQQLKDIVDKEQSEKTDPVVLASRWEELGKDPTTLFGKRCYERAIEVLEEGDKTQSPRTRQKNYRLEIRRLENKLKM